jgi:tetratricopeptide (TPR) repeat protein
VSVSLDNVARIEHARGDLDAALAKYEESLGIRRALAESLGTPESLRDVSVSLENVAGIEHARGDLDAARTKYEESLGIQRALAESLGTPDAANGVVWTAQLAAGVELALERPGGAIVRLDSLVDLALSLESSRDQNHLDTAAAYWERRVEVLEVLEWNDEAADSRARAAALRARIG